MNRYVSFRWAARAVLMALAATVTAAETFWDAAEKHCLLRDYGAADGTRRHGFVWHRFDDTSKAPPGTPSAAGWYRPAGQGTTGYWFDDNGNGQKDDGEVRPVSYALYVRTGVADFRKDPSLVDVNPEVVLAEITRGQPLARRVSGLLSDEPAVVMGCQCFAVAAGLQLWVDTDAYLVVSLDQSRRYETSGRGWLSSKRDDPQYTSAHFTAPAQLDAAIRTLHAGPCGKASADAAIAMARAWNAEVGGRVADGPGFKGFYPTDLSAYLPAPGEVAGNYLWSEGVDGSEYRRQLEAPNGGPRASIVLRSHTELWSDPTEPIARASQAFAEATRDAEPVAIPGADAAGARAEGQYRYSIWFRRGNVVGLAAAISAGNGATLAKPQALARRLAEVSIAKLRGTVVPPPGEIPPRRYSVVAKRQGSDDEWFGFGGMVELGVRDTDGDPVPYESVMVMESDPTLGSCEVRHVLTGPDGRAALRYRLVRPGVNRLRFSTSFGESEFALTGGGIVLDAHPRPAATKGEWEIRARVVDAVALRPVRDVPVRLQANDAALRRHGRVSANLERTGADGEIVFVYEPPSASGESPPGIVEFNASVDEAGYPHRLFARTTALVVPPATQRE